MSQVSDFSGASCPGTSGGNIEAISGLQAVLVCLLHTPSCPNDSIISVRTEVCSETLHLRDTAQQRIESITQGHGSPPQGVIELGSEQPALQPVCGMEPPLCGLCLHSLGWSWALAPHLRSPNQCALWGEAQESLCGCINVFTCRSATLYKLGPLFLWDIQTTKTSRLRMAVCLRLPGRCRMHPAS